MTVIAFPAPFGTLADAPLKVLRPDLSARIANVNHVRSFVARHGVRTLSQNLLGVRRPSIVIEHGTDALRSAAVCVRSSAGITRAVIRDVDVYWTEPTP